MNTYTFGEEWLAYIESDIRKKHGIKKPIVKIELHAVNYNDELKDEIVNLLQKKILSLDDKITVDFLEKDF